MLDGKCTAYVGSRLQPLVRYELVLGAKRYSKVFSAWRLVHVHWAYDLSFRSSSADADHLRASSCCLRTTEGT